MCIEVAQDLQLTQQRGSAFLSRLENQSTHVQKRKEKWGRWSWRFFLNTKFNFSHLKLLIKNFLWIVIWLSILLFTILLTKILFKCDEGNFIWYYINFLSWLKLKQRDIFIFKFLLFTWHDTITKLQHTKIYSNVSSCGI